MTFDVCRSSMWSDEQPCEEAVRNAAGRWIVEIDSLDTLMAFIGRHGKIIVSADRDPNPEIEIYDGWRE